MFDVFDQEEKPNLNRIQSANDISQNKIMNSLSDISKNIEQSHLT